MPIRLDFIIQEPKVAPDKPEIKRVDPSRKAIITERKATEKAPTKEEVAAALAAEAARTVPAAKVEETPAPAAKPAKKK